MTTRGKRRDPRYVQHVNVATQAGTSLEERILAKVPPSAGGAGWVQQTTAATSSGNRTDFSDAYPYGDGDLAVVGATNWEQDSAFGNLNVASNKVKPNTGGLDGSVRLTAAAFGTMNPNAQWAMCKFDVFAQFIGPTVFDNGAGTKYLCDCRNSETHIFRVLAGVFGSSIGNSAVIGWASGDLAYIEADSETDPSKTTVRVYKGGLPGTGSLAVSVEDTSGSRILSGRQGKRMWHADAAARIDDFSAGDNHPAGALDNFDLDGTLTYLRATGASPRFTGFVVNGATPVAGNQVLLQNVGTGVVTISHQDTGSTAANRVITATGLGISLLPNDRALGVYDDVTDRWRMSVVGSGDVTFARALTITSLRG